METASVCSQKRLEKDDLSGHSCLGSCCLTRAQLSMLLEGIDWRSSGRTSTPELTI